MSSRRSHKPGWRRRAATRRRGPQARWLRPACRRADRRRGTLGVDAAAKRIAASRRSRRERGRELMRRRSRAPATTSSPRSARTRPDDPPVAAAPLRDGLRPRDRAEAGRQRSEGAKAMRRQTGWRDFWLNVIRNLPENRTTSTTSASGACVARRSRVARGLEAGRDRRALDRRRHAAAARRGLDAQPGADGRRLLPDQEPADRLARGRGALHAAPARRRRIPEQRQLAVGGIGRAPTRSPTSGSSTRSVSRSGSTPMGSTCGAGSPRSRGPPDEHLAAPWEAPDEVQEEAGCRHRKRLSGAARRPEGVACGGDLALSRPGGLTPVPPGPRCIHSVSAQ